MNLDEAYSILELPKGASAPEATKKFRELSKIYHPDNKKTGDNDKFVKLNKAHQTILNPPKQNLPFSHGNAPRPGGFPFQRQHHFRTVGQIDITANLSFKESVLGCSKKVKYKREIKCSDCNGEGITFANNGCTTCNGMGQVAKQQNNMIFIKTCEVCRGKREAKKCNSCDGSGVLESETELSINIPGGVTSNSIMRLADKGNFAGSFGPIDQYTDTFIHLEIEIDPNLSIQDQFVISKMPISLLEAIRGCKKTAHTVLGNKEIEIKPLSKHKDEVIISHVGINGTGDQKVILEVNYPENTNLLLDSLIQYENSKLTAENLFKGK